MVNSGERWCITIEILDDSDVEGLEWLRVQLDAQSFPGLYGYCTIYITDNDGKSIITLHNYKLSLTPGHSYHHCPFTTANI